jgi:hypothetical protein
MNSKDKAPYYKMDEEAEEEENTFTCIMCNNITDNKIYIYSQSGVLLKQMDSSKILKQYGKAICFSHNCRNVIQRRSIDQINAMELATNEEREMQKVSINIMHLSIFQYTFIKEINFYERVKRLIPAGMWLSTLDSPAKMQQSVKMEFVINRDFDVCAKITKKI